MRNRFWLAGGLSALALVLLASAPARAETANIEKMFREGVDAFEMGDFATAKRLLEKVIELDPTSEEAARLVKECGLKTMIRMMTEPSVGRGPHRVWDLYREFQRARVRNEERTREMVGFVVDDKTPLPTVWKYMQELQDIGQFAVPALAPHLANEKDDDMRTRARIACTKLGAQAVLPLIELLDHESLLMKQNAALILGDIEPSDSRAVGPLKKIYEDAKSP